MGLFGKLLNPANLLGSNPDPLGIFGKGKLDPFSKNTAIPGLKRPKGYEAPGLNAQQQQILSSLQGTWNNPIQRGPTNPGQIPTPINPAQPAPGSFMQQAMQLSGVPTQAQTALKGLQPRPRPTLPPRPNYPTSGKASRSQIASAFREYKGRAASKKELDYYSGRKRADQLYRDVIAPNLQQGMGIAPPQPGQFQISPIEMNPQWIQMLQGLQ
jgi:hypothetical protein